MRICYLTPEYPPGRSGGIGTSVAHRARALVAAGHEVHVVGPGPTRTEDDHGVHVAIAPVRHPPKLGWLVVRRQLQARLRRLVAERGIQLVVAPDWTGLSAGIRPGCPVVVDCNGSATYFGDELGEPVRPSVRWAERRAVREAAAVTSVSTYVAERTASLLGWSDAIAVIPNAVDLGGFPEADDAAREAATVLHVGTVVRKKGVLDLAAAFRAVQHARPDARLRVIGPDAPDGRTGAPSTWDLVAEALGPAAVATTWEGSRPWDALAEAYGSATVLVVPSHAEANPLVWIEALASGLPVVAYDHPWAREVVEHDVSGVLVPAHDQQALGAAVIALLDHPDRRRRLGQAAARRARSRFGTDVLVRRLEERYHEVLNVPAPATTSGPP
jgi:glycosyltransferase involved in cell wall biosynthesis